MTTIKMSVIRDFLRDFQASLNSPLPPPSVDHARAAHEQVAQLGEEPTPTQLATLMVTMLNKNMYEAKRSTDLLSQHETEIADLKEEEKTRLK